jgi:predicted phosphodiesterase
MPRSFDKRFAATALVILFSGVAITHSAIQPKNDFRFSILGDRTGDAQPEIYGRIWREVDMLHPDFVINVGDTIQGGKERPQAEIEQQWTDLRPIWERYAHYPLYFTPGNHDVFNDTSAAMYERESKRPLCYSFNYQDAHFTVLDNSRVDALTDEQLSFLEKDLRKHKDKRPKFVFFHKPFWIAKWKAPGAEFALHTIARRYGVEHIISGHGHQFVRIVRDGIAYMEVGSSGGTMAKALDQGAGFKDGRFYHHVRGRVRGGKVMLTVKELDGPKGAGRMFRTEDWDENGPRFQVQDPASTEKPST